MSTLDKCPVKTAPGSFSWPAQDAQSEVKHIENDSVGVAFQGKVLTVGAIYLSIHRLFRLHIDGPMR